MIVCTTRAENEKQGRQEPGDHRHPDPKPADRERRDDPQARAETAKVVADHTHPQPDSQEKSRTDAPGHEHQPTEPQAQDAGAGGHKHPAATTKTTEAKQPGEHQHPASQEKVEQPASSPFPTDRARVVTPNGASLSGKMVEGAR